MLTDKQRLYIANRAAGLGQERSAVAAGYAAKSAKVIASRMERIPEIRAAIDEARKTAQPSSDAPQEFADPEFYLLAVVRGTAPPDPVRVGAARALLPFTKRRQRVPLAAVRAPKAQQVADESQAGADLNARFKNRVVELATARKKGA